MEILNIPTPSRTRLQAKLRLYKSEAEKLKRDLVNKRNAIRLKDMYGILTALYREETQQLFLKTRIEMNCLVGSDQAMMMV